MCQQARDSTPRSVVLHVARTLSRCGKQNSGIYSHVQTVHVAHRNGANKLARLAKFDLLIVTIMQILARHRRRILLTIGPVTSVNVAVSIERGGVKE